MFQGDLKIASNRSIDFGAQARRFFSIKLTGYSLGKEDGEGVDEADRVFGPQGNVVKSVQEYLLPRSGPG